MATARAETGALGHGRATGRADHAVSVRSAFGPRSRGYGPGRPRRISRLGYGASTWPTSSVRTCRARGSSSPAWWTRGSSSDRPDRGRVPSGVHGEHPVRGDHERRRDAGIGYVDVDIYGEIGSLTVNGIDVGPLVEAELDRRHPSGPRCARPTRRLRAWDVVERLWDGTVAPGPAPGPDLLHESVDGEWSFIETLRHLVFATDSWIQRAILGDPAPWDPLDLPWTRCLTRRASPRPRRPPVAGRSARATPGSDGHRGTYRRPHRRDPGQHHRAGGGPRLARAPATR